MEVEAKKLNKKKTTRLTSEGTDGKIERVIGGAGRAETVREERGRSKLAWASSGNSTRFGEGLFTHSAMMAVILAPSETRSMFTYFPH